MELSPHDVVDGETAALFGDADAALDGFLLVDGGRAVDLRVGRVNWRIDGWGTRIGGRVLLDVDLIGRVVVDARDAGERHVAFAAHRMGENVPAQVAVAPEDLLARRTLVRLQVGVRQ